jgi:hypothetical protein
MRLTRSEFVGFKLRAGALWERQRKAKNGTLVRGTLVLFAIFEFAQTIRIIVYNIYIIYNY